MTHSFPTRRSSDLRVELGDAQHVGVDERVGEGVGQVPGAGVAVGLEHADDPLEGAGACRGEGGGDLGGQVVVGVDRSEEHTSELQSLMRISYAVFCLKKKRHTRNTKIKQQR